MKTAASVREKLGWNLVSPVHLEQIYHNLYSRRKELHLPCTFECGPGMTMLLLLEKVNARARKQGFSVYSS